MQSQYKRAESSAAGPLFFIIMVLLTIPNRASQESCAVLSLRDEEPIGTPVLKVLFAANRKPREMRRAHSYGLLLKAIFNIAYYTLF